MSDSQSNGSMTCRELSRKRNGEDGEDLPGITVLIACPDEATAKAEAVRIASELKRPVYERAYKDKGKRTPRFTIYRRELTTNVVVA